MSHDTALTPETTALLEATELQSPVTELTYSRHFEARRGQTFPIFTPDEIARIRPFAELHRYASGEKVYETGKSSPGMLVILSGVIRITVRDGHGHDVPTAEHGAGALCGELAQFSGRRSFVDGVANEDVVALLIPPSQMRALLIGEAELGERIMRAMILRRVALLETGAGGPVIVGGASTGRVALLRDFLRRNSIPHLLLDPAEDSDAQALVARCVQVPDDLPLAVCPDGSVLRNPTENELARCIGMLDADNDDAVCDVAIVGAGPGGLATAVYAASEGLTTAVIDARAFGGQAGASSRIENYLGFPTGISGPALTARAYIQAQKFGARMLIPAAVTRLTSERVQNRDTFSLHLADGRTVRSKTVVIAAGARYRRPDCADLQAMEGHGVWYWASPIEAGICAGKDVVIVGGGNSAAQAAVFLARHARKVFVLVRGPSLSAGMSQYLVDRITGTPNIELRTRTEIVGVTRSAELNIESVRWRQRDSGLDETHPIRHVFLFLGAEPATDWLRDCAVMLDKNGFVETGPRPTPHQTGARNIDCLPLETSMPGVFAVGDVRLGSVKRVGGAIGEGAAAVAQIHAFIAAQSTLASPKPP